MTNQTVNQQPAEDTNELPSFEASFQSVDKSKVPGMSIFQTNIHDALKTGMTQLEAYHYAVDYYRKFTRRESTANFDVVAATHCDDDALSAFDLTQFNQVVNLICKATRDRSQQVYFFSYIRLLGLDHHMDEENTIICKALLGDFYPEEIKDIAKFMGFAVQPNGSCQSMTRHKTIIRGLCDMLGLKELMNA